MNGIADTLVKAAVEWRGRPETFEPGALGSVGDTFNDAFAGAGFAATEGGRSLAFEYFVGLIFNADYEDLGKLAASWLQLVDLIVEFPPAVRALYVAPDCLWPVAMSLITGIVSYQYEWSCPEKKVYGPKPLVRSMVRLYRSRPPFYGGKWSIWTDKGTWIKEPIHGIPTLFPPGSYVNLRWKGPPMKVDKVSVREGGLLPVFRISIADAVDAYVESERAVERPYPDPTATAHADNGYVFSNWAQGKFGSPEVQTVGI